MQKNIIWKDSIPYSERIPDVNNWYLISKDWIEDAFLSNPNFLVVSISVSLINLILFEQAKNMIRHTSLAEMSQISSRIS